MSNIKLKDSQGTEHTYDSVNYLSIPKSDSPSSATYMDSSLIPTTTSVLKGDGAGGITAATAGTDYITPATQSVSSVNTRTGAVTGLAEQSTLDAVVEPLINQWDEQWEICVWNEDGKVYSPGNVGNRTPIEAKGSTKYFAKVSSGSVLMVTEYNSNMVMISRNDYGNQEFTTNANTKYICLNTSIAYGTTYNNDISINYPSTYTAYYPSRLPKDEAHIKGLGNVIGMRGWNQLVIKNSFTTTTLNGVTLTNNGDGSITLNGTATADTIFTASTSLTINGNKVAYIGAPKQAYGKYILYDGYGTEVAGVVGEYMKTVNHPSRTIYLWVFNGVTLSNERIYPQMVDLTSTFGAGYEPSSVSDFRAMFPADYYPYCSGEFGDLLWTNGSPTSSFASQTVSINLSGYRFVYIVFNRNDTSKYSTITEVGTTGTGISIYDGKLIIRSFSVTTSGVNFTGGAYYNSYSTPTNNDSYCIPVSIYGIR